MLGNSEFAVRIPTVGATLIAAACVYALTWRAYNRQVALLARWPNDEVEYGCYLIDLSP